MIVIDVESSGANPNKNSILSLAALDFNNPENIFYEECRLDSGAEVDPESLKVNGFTLESIEDPSKQSVEELIVKFLLWAKPIKNKVFVAQNTWFDKEFLRMACEKYNLDWPFGRRVIDLHSLAYMEMLKANQDPNASGSVSELSLSKIAEHYGLPKQPEPHNALSDAKIQAEVLSRMVFKKNLLKEFEKYTQKAR